MEKEKVAIYKKWWFWTIVVLSIIIIVLMLIIFSSNMKVEKQDNTALSSYEVVTYLESKGYTFETQDFMQTYLTHYIILKNDSEGIWIQKIDNELTGIMLRNKNSQINDEFADMTGEHANETKEEQQQYEAYINWLKDMGLTKMQLVDALNFYDSMY